MNPQTLLNEFIKLYGSADGTRIFHTIMPGVLSDFSKMLSAGKPGETIREEYTLEDRKATLVLTGKAKEQDLSRVEAQLRI